MSTTKKSTGYPTTFAPDAPDGAPKLFEPALKQFPHAFRKGEPSFPHGAIATIWRQARQQVMDHLLSLIANSRWQEHLVLRGSLALTAWLEGLARAPGDMDWVVQPPELQLAGEWSRDLFEGLVALTASRPNTNGLQILADQVAMDDIWTYERAPGRRMVFPWRCAGLPPGVVQLDFVFGEELGAPAVKTAIPRADGGSCKVWAASPEQSLAWKLLWLATDSYPQGKDLYDATLLAERFELSRPLLQHALAPAKATLTADSPLKWDVDWASFKLEYPDVRGDLEEWKDRLCDALAATFR